MENIERNKLPHFNYIGEYIEKYGYGCDDIKNTYILILYPNKTSLKSPFTIDINKKLSFEDDFKKIYIEYYFNNNDKLALCVYENLLSVDRVMLLLINNEGKICKNTNMNNIKITNIIKNSDDDISNVSFYLEYNEKKEII